MVSRRTSGIGLLALGVCGLSLATAGCAPVDGDPDKTDGTTEATDDGGDWTIPEPDTDDTDGPPDSADPVDSADSGDPDSGDSAEDTGEVRLDAEVCDNGVDDDWSGAADCGDAACADVGTCGCVDADAGALLGTLWTGAIAGSGDDDQGECTSQPGGEDVHVLWTPPADGCFELSTEGSSFDTTLAVGAAWCGGPTISCNDDAPTGLQSRITLSAREGRTVLLLAEAYDAYQSGDLVVTALAGDDFAEPVDVDAGSDVGNGVLTGVLSDATAAVDHPCSDVTGASAVVRWEAPEAGTWAFTSTGSDFDPSITLFGQCATPMVCDDHLAGDRQADARVFLSEGDVVHLAIGGVEESTGTWVLNVTGPL